MKVFLILIACLQSTVTPLEKSCTLQPLNQPFESVSDCLGYVQYFKSQVESADPDMYITGFCTTKLVDSA